MGLETSKTGILPHMTLRSKTLKKFGGFERWEFLQAFHISDVNFPWALAGAELQP